MKQITSLTFLAKLIELHGKTEFYQAYQGDYFNIDLVCLFNSKLGEISRLIKEKQLFYQ